MDPSVSPGDEELIRGIADGDELAFRLYFRRWAPPLGRFLNRVAGSRETAEDLLQETFLRVLRAAPRYTPHGSPRAWVYRIAANLAYSHWRQRKRAPGLQPIKAEAAVAPRDPECENLRRAWMSEAGAAVGRLPENHRLVFLLKVDQGLTYEEVAAVLGCPTGTAKSRFHHAVRRLRDALRDWEDIDLEPSTRPAEPPGREAHVV
jgi:RNA polymerase sigma-70 factor (ECF subfamily)